MNEIITTGLEGRSAADLNSRIADLKRLKNRLNVGHLGRCEHDKACAKIDRKTEVLVSLKP